MRHKSMRALAPLAAAIGLAACAGDNPVEPVAPGAAPTPTVAAPPAPTPTPPPVTQPPEPDPRPNRPPTVAIAGGGSCHPKVGQPCTVEFTAEASDRDGDAYRLEWEGCTSGSGATAACTIDRPGEHVATVFAIDARGAKARASATALGTNLPPILDDFGPPPPDPAPSNTFYAMVGYEPYDPDDWPPERNLACPTSRVTVTGACVGGLAWCGGIANAFDIDLRTTTGPGTCLVEATVTDPWGAVARRTLSFRVLAP
jgi:hypothetical protein